ncbi:MAG: ribosome maturation factor RimM [Thermodesulfobacteriota bacterium]
MSKSDRVPVGRVTGAHGIRGEVRVHVYGGLGEDGFPWKEVFLVCGDRTSAREITRMRPHKGALIVQFEGPSTRDEAKGLVGCEVEVPASDLPEPGPGEYYYRDLVGMDVWTAGQGAEAEYLGRVMNIIPTGGNDVFEVTGPRGEVLIPAISEVVLDVDQAARKITVRLLEGLIETPPEGGRGAAGSAGGRGGKARGDDRSGGPGSGTRR